MRLLSLEQAAAAAAAEIGGKARGLARLAALGLPVPDALVVPASAVARWRGEAGEWWKTVERLGAPLAVRSSAADEDSAEHSAAGQYESVMDVRDEAAFAAAVERCVTAADSPRASAYRGGGDARLALVVQREIDAQRAGVAFSVDPVAGRREAIVIEAVFGHGEGIVAGEVAPDRYAVDRATGDVQVRVADKALRADGRGALLPVPFERRLARVLRDDEARAVAELVTRAEDGFGAPVDVEFCLRGETLWMLQCRPVTTLDGAR